MKESCLHQSNYLACDRQEALNTAGRSAAAKLRKCKLVSSTVAFAAKFEIINPGAGKKGSGGWGG